MSLVELQIDRLVGPTHHFGGLGVGNVASQTHAGQVSNPRAAAIQGLNKMRLVSSLGAPQLILPPQLRPAFGLLRSLGFRGSDGDVMRRAMDEAPSLLSAATSCSAMWTANAATVTPGIDSGHGSTLVTIANLDASIHRAIEPEQTWKELKRILSGPFELHGPLPGGTAMRDEGAANHMRLGTGENSRGINVFVYGDGVPMPRSRWPRQSRLACEAIARLHRLPPQDTILLKQHPDAIDAGAFHNDVVAMSHHSLLIHHELAFAEASHLQRLEDRFRQVTGSGMIRISVPETSLSLADAIKTYLFNSQIISSPDASSPPVIICASQVRDHTPARSLVDDWCEQRIFDHVEYVDLDQSMSGGGGPACLRLRVPLPIEALGSTLKSARWSESLDQKLRDFINEKYTSALTINDLAREEFHAEYLHVCHEMADLLFEGNS